MIKYLTPLLNSNKNVSVLSDTISANVSGTATCVGCTLIKNGVDSGLSSTSIVSGDTLVLKVLTSPIFSTAVQAACSVGPDTYIFQVVTKDDTHLYAKTEFDDIGPLDSLSLPDTVTYTPRLDLNTLEVISPVTGLVTNTIGLVSPSQQVTLDSAEALIIVMDYYADKVLFIGPTSLEVVASLSLPAGSLPSSGLYTVDADNKRYDWVTASGTNHLLKIDLQSMSIVNTVFVGNRPLGLAVDRTNNTLWVSNFLDNTVSKVSYAGVVLATYAVGAGPTELVVDPLTRKCWVACSRDNRVFILDPTSGNVTAITVGENPWDIEIVGNVAYVSNSWDGTISKISTSTYSVVSTYYVCAYPGDLTSDAVGNLWVASFGESSIFKISNDVIVSTTPVAKIPRSITFDATGNLWVASMYGGTPIRTYVYDYLPDRISFLPLIGVAPNTVVSSTQAVISGLGTGLQVPCSIPNVLGFSLLKNGTSVGVSTTVTNGDQIGLQQTTDPSLVGSITQEVKVVCGQQIASFAATTLLEDVTPNQITFVELAGASTGTPFTSNTVTLSGMTAGVTSVASVDRGVLVVNEVNTGLQSASVSNGDGLAISMSSALVADQTVTSKITIGTMWEEWTILTSQTYTDYTGVLPVIADVTPAPLDQVVTATVVVSGITDPPLPDPLSPDQSWAPNTALLKIGNFPDNLLTLGLTSGTTLVVKNGDLVLISVRSAKAFNTTTTRTVFLNQHPLTFNVTTALDNQPDLVVFRDQMETIPWTPYTSNAVTISGMDVGVMSPVTVTIGTISVNGIDKGQSATVVDGDLLSWTLSPEGPYSGTRTYTMDLNGVQATWSFYNMSLLGASKDQKYVSYSGRRSENLLWVEHLNSHSVAATHPAIGVVSAPTRITNQLVYKKQPLPLNTLGTKGWESQAKPPHFLNPYAKGSWKRRIEIAHNGSPVAFLKQSINSEAMVSNSWATATLTAYGLASCSWNTAEYPTAIGRSVSREWDIQILGNVTASISWVEQALAEKLSRQDQWAIPVLPNRVLLQSVAVHLATSLTYMPVGSAILDTLPLSRILIPFLSKIAVKVIGNSSASLPMGQIKVDNVKAVRVPNTALVTERSSVILEPLHYAKAVAVTKTDLGLGIGNTPKTLRFATQAQAISDGTTRWKFTSVQAVSYGDGTYIWIGNCSTYKPFKLSGYLSGG